MAMAFGVCFAGVNLLKGNFTDLNRSIIQISVLAEIIIFSAGLANQQKTIEEEKGLALTQKRLEDLKTKLYTNFTHELRTPLTIINGFSEEISNYQDHNIAKKAKFIHKNGHRMLNLVNQILMLRKLESGTFEVKRKPGDIAIFLGYVTESFQSLAASKHLQLIYLADPNRISTLFDEEHLEQILSNLLSNAIKFTPERGKITVALSISNEDQLIIKVTDSGPGIPIDQEDKIFDHFFQADNQSKNTRQSSGIGLTIVKELVQQMEGTIEAKNVPGKGAQFIIKLPLTPISENLADDKEYSISSPPPILIEPDSEKSPTSSNLPILLLIEDNPDVVYYLQTVLESLYTIHVAKNGQAGLDKAKQLIPDVIISDLMMPIMDGYQLCEQLKSNPDTCQIPVVMLTARPTVEDRIKAFNVGVDAYLSKPFNRWELITRLVQLREARNRLQDQHINIGLPTLEKIKSKTETETPFLKKLKTIIEANYQDENFDVNELTTKMAMSRANLYRKVKSTTQHTPSEWIKYTRLHKAKTLLETTDQSIQEIAFEVGYKDHSHFTRLYSQAFGTLPKDSR